MTGSSFADRERSALGEIIKAAMAEQNSSTIGDGYSLDRLHIAMLRARRSFAWSGLAETCKGMRPFVLTFDQEYNSAECFSNLIGISCGDLHVEDEELFREEMSALGVSGDAVEWGHEFAAWVNAVLEAHSGSLELERGGVPHAYVPSTQAFTRLIGNEMTASKWLQEGMTAAEYILALDACNTAQAVTVPVANELIAHSSPEQILKAVELIDATQIDLEGDIKALLIAGAARLNNGLSARRNSPRNGM